MGMFGTKDISNESYLAAFVDLLFLVDWYKYMIFFSLLNFVDMEMKFVGYLEKSLLHWHARPCKPYLNKLALK